MERLIGQRWSIIAAVLFSFIILPLNAAWSGGATPNAACSGGATPEDVVQKYYQALKNRDFPEAYQYTSKGMRDGKDQKQWVDFMKDLFEGGKVTFTEISVTPGAVSEKEAQVNTMINSKDIFNKNGLIEYNVEHLVPEDCLWKIDRTELKDSKILDPS